MEAIPIILIVGILLFVIVAKAHNNANGDLQKSERPHNLDYERIAKLQAFHVEAPNRIRIFNDSTKLIENTVNVTTFVTRVRELDEFLKWADTQFENGMPIKVSGTDLQYNEYCYRLVNDNALRVANEEYDKWNNICHVRGKRFDRATAKAFESIDALLDCLRTAENIEEIEQQLHRIRNTIEDVYSDV